MKHTNAAEYKRVMNEGGEGYMPTDAVIDHRAEDKALLDAEIALLARTEERAASGDFSAMVSVDAIKARITAIQQRLA